VSLTHHIHIYDSRIRFELNDLIFIDNTDFNQSCDAFELLEYIHAEYPDTKNALNHFFTQPSPTCNSEAWGAYGVHEPSNSTVVLTWGSMYNETSAAIQYHEHHIAHEYGHAVGLGHTYDWEIREINHYDFLDDVFGTCVVPSCDCDPDPGYICYFTQECIWNDYPNNTPLMCGKYNQRYISPKSMGRMHRGLHLYDHEFYFDTRPIHKYVKEDHSSPYPHVINEDETWDFAIKMYQDILVEGGNTLTINCEVKMPIDGKIIVEAGAKLIVDGGLITSAHDEKWKGIEVWGQSENGQDYWQGSLELYDATIENAKIGVYLGHPDNNMRNGGILKAEDSDFKNNDIAVYFPEYHNRKWFPEGIVELDNVSQIKYCNFINNDDYMNDSEFEAHLKLESVKGITIKQSTFISGGKSGIGIDAFDAGFYVSGTCNNSMGCTSEEWEYSSFTGYDKAIYTRNATSPLYSINIYHSEFDNNQYGVYANNLDHVTNIKNCIFKVGKNTDSKEKQLCTEAFGRGIHIGSSNNFHIEYNRFEPAPGLSSADDIMGISASNNPSVHDIIYANEFEGLQLANYAFGINRLDPALNDHGIEYRCNENTTNFIDFELNGDDETQILIHENQGDEYISAHNSYSVNSDPNAKHWRNMGSMTVNYYLHSGEENTVNEPTKIETIMPNEYFEIKTNVSAINQCPDNTGIQQEKTVLSPEEIQEEEQRYFDGYTDFQSVETIYTDLKDGGSTKGTSLTIASAQPDDTWELRADLLGKSPHLSKQILMEASDRTDVLPNSVLLDILAANPDELKKADLMEYLENKEEPLPDYMIDILQELSHGSTYKTVLINQMSRYKRQYMKAANNILNSLLNDEQQNPEAIRNWLDNIGGVNTDLQIAQSFIQEDNFIDAVALLELIPDLYDLQGDELNKYLDDKSVLLLQMDLKQSSRTLKDLNATELAQLESWAINDNGKARAFARHTLETYYGNTLFCDCIDRMQNKSSEVDLLEEEKVSPVSIEATPNPASHYVEFVYKLSEIDGKGEIIITDIHGKQVQSFSISYQEGVQAWDTREVPAGSYIFTLKTKYFEKSGKLIIQ